MNLIFMNVGSFLCFGIAGYLVSQNQDGWGWFLFVGLLIYGATTMKIKEKDEKDE